MNGLGQYGTTRSIKTRLLISLLSIGAIVAVVIGWIAVVTTRDLSQTAKNTSIQALRTQAEEYLLQLTQSNANENDLILEQLRLDALKLADYAAYIFSNTPGFRGTTSWLPEEEMVRGTDGQYSNSTADITSVFVPSFQQVNSGVLRDIELGAALETLMVTQLDNNANLEAIYFATQNEVTRYYPNIDLGAVLPPDFQVTQRPWYTGSNIVNNPEMDAWWVPVYVDATGLGLVTTAAAPVYTLDGEWIGVVGFDVTLNSMRDSVEATRILRTGYSFLIDQSGQSVALPDKGYLDVAGRPREADEANIDLSQVDTAFAPVIRDMLDNNSGFTVLEVAGEELFVAYAPLKQTGWSMASVARSEDVLESIAQLGTQLESTNNTLIYNRILPAAALIFLATAVIGYILAGRLTDPIQKLALAARKVASGKWDAEIPTGGQDEIGLLAEAFEAMTKELHNLFIELEERVQARTSDLSRRTEQLEAAAQVAREALSIRDITLLLDRVTQLISNRFGYYHVGIFLVDEAREFAMLEAANSRGGKRMLAHGHNLKIGEVGIVGNVAWTGKPRLAFDVGADAYYFKNPDLPETRSEMAIPLKIQERVIGVLDVQSTQPSAFSEEDIHILQVLADQLALAVETARLFGESQQAINELNRVYGREVNIGWDERLRQHPLVYVYDRHGVKAADTDQTDGIYDASGKTLDDDGRSMSLAMRVQDKVIGRITLRRDVNQAPWTADEIQLIEQAIAQITPALENARLLEEAQVRAAREKAVNILSTQLRGATSIETIMKSTVRELGKALGVSRTFIQVGIEDAPSTEQEKSSHD